VLCFRFVFLCPVYPILPVSLDFPFLIAPSVFSNVYLFALKFSGSSGGYTGKIIPNRPYIYNVHVYRRCNSEIHVFVNNTINAWWLIIFQRLYYFLDLCLSEFLYTIWLRQKNKVNIEYHVFWSCMQHVPKWHTKDHHEISSLLRIFENYGCLMLFATRSLHFDFLQNILKLGFCKVWILFPTHNNIRHL
jgi:hypothetical protein